MADDITLPDLPPTRIYMNPDWSIRMRIPDYPVNLYLIPIPRPADGDIRAITEFQIRLVNHDTGEDRLIFSASVWMLLLVVLVFVIFALVLLVFLILLAYAKQEGWW